MSWIEKNWYRDTVHPLLWLLLPLMLLFWLVSGVRRWAYQHGVKSSQRVNASVIVVGNISVGGNGKTPLVVALVRMLTEQGYRPGVLSRGYGGQGISYPAAVGPDSSPAEFGDEPVLMRANLDCPLVVDPNRARGATCLIEGHGCDLIVCDDGLQHYALARDIEIAVVDGNRQLGNRRLLPVGPLREGPWRLNSVDFVVQNGGAETAGRHLMTLDAQRLVNVADPQKRKELAEIDTPVHAIAGIGHPQRFFDLLADNGVALKSSQAFPDHHGFSQEDLPAGCVLMTEKDAVKCRLFAQPDWWYLPVEAQLGKEFTQALINRLKAVRNN